MANLLRRDSIFDDLFDFRRDLDHVFNRFFSSSQRNQQQRNAGDANDWVLAPPVNAYIDKDGKRFRCEVALPGIEPKDVNIQVQGNILSVQGERRVTNENRNADYVQREMVYGSFERDIELPEGVDVQNITAEYRNGVLEISAPISAAALPRRIEIKSGQEARQIAAGSGR